MIRLDVEQAYLGEAARTWARGEAAIVPPPDGLNRPRLLQMLANQSALPALAPHLSPDALPSREQAQHVLAVEVARRRTIVMLLELERILPALAECRCRPVVLKGASLALTVYDRPDDRWFLDLDLLVERRDLAKVYAALERLGYRFANVVCPVRYYEDHHFHRILISNQGVCIEVHWALTLPSSVYTYDLEALRRDCLEIPLGGASFLAPGFQDQILHGVLQSTAGGFGDLRRILDLHLLDARLDESQRRQLCARAQLYNLTTGLWLQYRVRELLLAQPMPPTVAEACRPPAGLIRLFDQLEVARNCLALPAERREGYDYFLHCLCVPPRRRTREFWRYLFPTVGSMLEAGLGREGRIKAWPRVRLHLSRLWSAIRLLIWLARIALRTPAASKPATC